MNISSFIIRDFFTTGPFTGVTALRNQLLQKKGIAILENDHFFGVLTVNDIINRPHILAIDCLTAKSPLEIDSTIYYALQAMKHENTDVLPVLKNNKIYGLVFKNDLIDYLTVNSQNTALSDEAESLKKENKEFRSIILQQKIDLESVIEKRTQDLIDLVETKEKFIGIIAHELRNPFTSILGFLNLLKDNLREYDIDSIEKFITHIHHSATTTYDLLVNLLEWLNAKNKKVPFHAVEININRVFVEEILTGSAFAAEQKNISIEVDIPENIQVFVDINMLKTIFRNLIGNAIKFTAKGGNIIISAYDSERFAEISIKDSGVGLTPDTLEKIFSIEGVTSTKGTINEKGTGLGLLLCKEFIEIEGGEIWVESTLGVGSEFKFTLPKFINIPNPVLEPAEMH